MATPSTPSTPPPPYERMKQEYPGVLAAYEALATACAAAGPLDGRTIALVKLATSLGAGLQGAARSHARKALEAGCSREQLLHVALLGTPTIGFPTMMRNRSWILEVAGEPAA